MKPRNAIGAASLQNHNPIQDPAPSGRHIPTMSLLAELWSLMNGCSKKLPALRALKKLPAIPRFTLTCNFRPSRSVKYGNMNTKHLNTAAKSAVLTTVLVCGINLRAATPQTLNDSVTSQNQFPVAQVVGFSEAQALTGAYLILATGDHDYKGHRVRAMHQIESAGKLLGMDLVGGAKDRQQQVLSDDKLREARGLLETVLGAAEVRDQPRISKHITEAINQIDIALSIR